MNVESVERAIESLDNCITSLGSLTTPANEGHVQALREKLPAIVAQLRSALATA